MLVAMNPTQTMKTRMGEGICVVGTVSLVRSGGTPEREEREEGNDALFSEGV
jgi:hypothetical protein